MKKSIKKSITDLLVPASSILAGNVLTALTVTVFILPSGVIMGGATGIALVLSHLTNMDTALLVFILNALFLILGAIMLGKAYFISTIASTILYPFFLAIFQRLPLDALTVENHLLSAIMGGILLGAGVGLVMRHGAGTGGTDSVSLTLNKITHLPIAVFVPIIDITILGAQAFFSSFEQVLYGITLTIIESLVLNRVILMGQSQIQVFVITDKFAEIRQKVLSELRAGVTIVKIETGMSRHEQDGLLSVIHPRMLHSFTELIQEIDHNAFITVMQVKEVRGQGFTSARIDYELSTSENSI